MAETIQAVRGMNDILPEEMHYWHFVEEQLRKLSCVYGYQEIRTPVLEKTILFKRSIGEVTDIVSKEMYTFDDRDGTSVTMRPEGTAGVVRAGLEHGKFYNQSQRLWYLGPIFRHERPQRGRYRQFHQFGLEAFGFPGAEIEVEQILFLARLWKVFQIDQSIELQLNSLGSPACRDKYRAALMEYWMRHESGLDQDSLIRLHKNPLRILDSKNPAMQDIIGNAPKLIDYLNEESIVHFQRVQELLEAANIPFVINSRLVRGLDYYSHTVFEWVTESLGAQGTVAAGGRYDVLIEQLGGQATPAFGFAMGMERIIEMLKETPRDFVFEKPVGGYLILVGALAQKQGLLLAETLRGELQDFILHTHLQGGSFKNQIKKADKSNARLAIIMGEDEVASNTVTIKYLREEKPQQTVSQTQLLKFLKA